MAQKRRSSSPDRSKAYLSYMNPRTQLEEVVDIISPKFSIGRSKLANLLIQNISVSRFHCYIEKDSDNNWTVVDESLAGTFVNKERIDRTSDLNDSDVINFATEDMYTLTFYLGDSAVRRKRRCVDKTGDADNVSTITINSSLESDVPQVNSSTMISDTPCSHPSSPPSIIAVSQSTTKTKTNCEQISTETNQEIELLKQESAEKQELELKVKKLVDEIECLRKQQAIVEKGLKLEVDVLEYRNKMNEAIIATLTSDNHELKNTVSLKDIELLEKDKQLGLKSNEKKEENEKMLLQIKQEILLLIENEFQCSICNEIIIEASSLECSHLFCSFCIKKWLKRKKECAVCRTPLKLNTGLKQRALDQFIDQALEMFSVDKNSHRKTIILERQEAEQQAQSRAVVTPRHNRRQGGTRRNRRPRRQDNDQQDGMVNQEPYLHAIPPVAHGFHINQIPLEVMVRTTDMNVVGPNDIDAIHNVDIGFPANIMINLNHNDDGNAIDLTRMPINPVIDAVINRRGARYTRTRLENGNHIIEIEDRKKVTQ